MATRDDAETLRVSAASQENHVVEGWSVGLLRHLLVSRRRAILFLAVAGAHGVSAAVGIPGFSCPFHAITGLPCPGCGLSRAGLFLATGRFRAMWITHPFAPYFAFLAVVLAGAALLPGTRRNDWISRWIRLEARMPIHAIALIGFTLFGAARVLGCLARPF